MLIECPFCHEKANLRESQEGAKVRCPSCSKVYVARERGRRGGSSGPSSAQLAIGGAVVVAVLLVLIVVNNAKDDGPATPEVQAAEEPEEVPWVDPTGWDSEPVLAVRRLYDAAAAFDQGKLTSLLSGPHLTERLRAEALEAAPDEAPAQAEWSDLDQSARQQLLRDSVQGFLQGEGDTVAALWEPYDGRVTHEEDKSAVVHVQVAARAADQADQSRTIEWKLVQEGGAWRVWSWARYISPEELAAGGFRNKEITKVELEGGARLYQADARVLEHLEDTPPELRARIDAAALRLVDFDLHPRENNAASEELIEIGRPSIPILLTAMHEIEIVDDLSLSKVTRVHHTLRDLTGYDPGFPAMAFGPESEAKREIAVKAWFAWWLRKGERRFQEREEGEDLLEGLIEPTERDLREMRRSRGRGNGR